MYKFIIERSKKIMKRKMFLKMFSLVVAVPMILTSIAGCSSKKKEEKGVPTTTSTESGYPIVKTPLTLKYWAPIHPNASQYIKNYNENEAYQEVEKRTGIHIDFIHPVQGQEKEQLQMLVAAGDLPDMIQGTNGNYNGDAAKGVADGVFLDLTSKMEKYAPDYYKLVNSEAETKRAVTDASGKYAAFYRIKPVGDPAWRRVLLRQDWLKELGLDIPKTVDDYEKVFKTILEKKNVAPYVLNNNGIEEQFLWPNNVSADFFLKDTKTIAYGQIDPKFKDYLTLMNKWFKAGYISKDFAGLQIAQALTMFESGKTAVVVDSIDAEYAKAKAVNISITPAPFPRLTADQKLFYTPREWAKRGEETVVTSKSKYPNEAMRWINFAFTEEGSRIYNFGVEGKSYVMENGKPKMLDYILNPSKFTSENANYILKIHFGPKKGDPDTLCNASVVKSPDSLAMRRMWSDDKNLDLSLSLPPIQLTAEENTARAKIMTEVNTYVNEMVLKFILGAEPLTKFDDYVAQVKKLKIDEAIKITQTAYDRHISKK
jgi:putative aldouronate transport system substrate-binding protein